MGKRTKKDNRGALLAFALIGIGIFWSLRVLGFGIGIPDFYWHKFFCPIGQFIHEWGRVIFSWQMILIIAGAVLLAGKRPMGIALVFIGVFFILPKFLHFLGFTFSLFFPVLLVAIGLAIVIKRI